jgi:hypothetical protein
LKDETGAPPDIAANAEIQQWIKIQVSHEEKHPLEIKRKDVFLPMLRAAMTSAPLNEQDVVSLFNQMLAGGVIRGIRVMSTSQHNKYDGVFRFGLEEPTANHVFNIDTNPLGIPKESTGKTFVSEPEILEYKYNLDALVHDIEKGEKIEKDIRLAVVWEIGEAWHAKYKITSLLDVANVHHRRIHGVTHLVRREGGGAADVVFYVVGLREMIEYINDPNGTQEYQRGQYQ